MNKHTKGPWIVDGTTVYALHEPEGHPTNRFWANVQAVVTS